MNADDFKKRTFQFGVRCVRLVDALPRTMAAQVVGKQLARSATSVGANYRAAARARSRADFVAKLGIVEEECDETLYWLEMTTELDFLPKDRTQSLYDEGNEILSIVISSIRTAKRNQSRKTPVGI
jgi:four helix bundle protein